MTALTKREVEAFCLGILLALAACVVYGSRYEAHVLTYGVGACLVSLDGTSGNARLVTRTAYCVERTGLP